MRCDRCSVRGLAKRGTLQPSDGDAAVLYIAAHGEVAIDGQVSLCSSCVRTLEAMSLRAAGEKFRAGTRTGAPPVR